MKTKLALATLTALAGLSTAQAESRFSPVIRAEATYTDTGYSGAFIPKGFELGTGLTAGVFINKKHEVSISTGLTKWTADTSTLVGLASSTIESEQIPVLLNYRYHLNLDQAGRFTAFAGPTAGLIHESISRTIVDLGAGLPASQVGKDTASTWKLAFGGTLGLKAKISDHWDVAATAQLLHVSSQEYVTHGGTATFKTDGLRPSFGLSVGYSW